jgi:hypothetical protein
MSQMKKPSSCGFDGSPPQRRLTCSMPVIMMSSCRSTWIVHVLSGPGTNFNTLGLRGSVTSMMVHPRCHRWPM